LDPAFPMSTRPLSRLRGAGGVFRLNLPQSRAIRPGGRRSARPARLKPKKNGSRPSRAGVGRDRRPRRPAPPARPPRGDRGPAPLPVDRSYAPRRRTGGGEPTGWDWERASFGSRATAAQRRVLDGVALATLVPHDLARAPKGARPPLPAALQRHGHPLEPSARPAPRDDARTVVAGPVEPVAGAAGDPHVLQRTRGLRGRLERRRQQPRDGSLRVRARIGGAPGARPPTLTSFSRPASP